MNVQLIKQKPSGPAIARNHGASRAIGEYLAFTDDDCEPVRGWLCALDEAFHRESQLLVGGRTVNALSQNPYSAASQMLIDYLYAYFNGTGQQTLLFTSNNLAVSREYFLKLGGFDTSFPLAAGEDREFCDRWHQAGQAHKLAPDAVVHHAHSLSFRSFFQQHYGYGQGAIYYRLARQRRQHPDVRIEPLSFYRDLLLLPFRKAERNRRWLYVALLAITQLANAMGFIHQATRSSVVHKWRGHAAGD